MASAQKVKYLRVPFGFMFLVAFLYLVSLPHRCRQGDSPHREARFTWRECVGLYFTFIGTVITVLFLWENVLAVIWPGPRRLSLSDDYINAEPPKVDKMKAFEYDTPVTLYEQVKFYFFLFTGIAVLRLLTLIVCFTFGTLMFIIAAGGGRRQHGWWFHFWNNIGVFFGHLGFAAVGVYNVRVYGTLAERHEAKLLLSNHSCVMEVVFMLIFNGLPSFVSRKENKNVFMFSALCDATDAILVDRDAATSRHQTLQAIKDRAKNPLAQQLMMFPEGTTANQNTLFLFKKGAFEPGEPVQLFCITFPYKHFNPCWTGRGVGGNNVLDIILRLCSQFVNHAEIRVLPVYHPTEAEKADPILYASHCQKMVAAVLRANISDATLKDYRQAEQLYTERTATAAAAALKKTE